MFTQMYIHRRQLAFAVLPATILLLLAAACGGGGDAADPGPTPIEEREHKIQVLTTLELFADFVREVGDPNIEVWSLVESDTEIHSFEPSDEDVEWMSRAAVILINSRAFETPILEEINQHRRGAAQLIRFAQNVPSPSQAEPGQALPTAEEIGDNPYLWLDPLAAGVYADSVADSLAIVDGINTDFYWAKSSEYKDRLRSLDAELQQTLDRVPPERRKIVTLRDTFPHFARHFGFDVVGVLQSDPDHEPTPDQVSALAQRIRDEEVRAIFHEPHLTSPALERLAAQSGARLCTLYSDTLDDNVKSYFELMRFNARQMVDCL